MRKLASVGAAALATLSLVAACDETPTSVAPDRASEVHASHGSTDGARSVTVDLKEINDSGITGEAVITDDGTSIVVSGTAEGLDPSASLDYLSLFYDKASPPKGPEACEPGTHDPNHPLFLTEAEMLGGIWTVDGNGNGTLHDLVGAYVPVNRVGTMSIRDLRINEGFGPEAVVACGKVTHDPAR